MDTEQEIDQFLMAYELGFNESKSDVYRVKKKDAISFASSLFPKLTDALVASGKMVREKRPAATDEERLGSHLGRRIRALGLKEKFARASAPNIASADERDEKDTGVDNRELGASELYRKACNQFDFVPNDNTLAFILGCTGAAFSHARNHLIRDEGYSFERVNGMGWKVTRPVIKKSLPAASAVKYTPDQIAAIVASVLKQIG